MNSKVELILGNSIDEMKKIERNSIDESLAALKEVTADRPSRLS